MTNLQETKPLMHLLSATFDSLQSATPEQLAHNPFLQLRKQGLDALARTGLPTPRDEEWKYLNLAPYIRHPYQLPAGKESLSHLPQILPITTIPVVFFNGLFQPHLLSPAHGVTVTSLAQLLDKGSHDGTVLGEQEHSIGQLLSPEDDPFVALNAALLHQGALLHITQNPSQPIYLASITQSDQPLFVNLRFAIRLSTGTAATVILDLRTLSKTAPTFHNIASEIWLETESALTLIFLQNDTAQNYGVLTTRIAQTARSRSRLYTVTAGNGMVRNTTSVQLNEPEAETVLYGLSVLRDTEVADHHTAVEHLAPNCQSSELYKSIVADQATNIFNGKIFVHPEAQQTNAYQSNHNILLSDDARVYTKPQLEIFADDVRCTHGATVGQLPQEAVFYLRTRGLPETVADVLLLHAFAGEVYEQLPLEPLRAWIDQQLSHRLFDIVDLAADRKLVDLQFATS